MELVLSLGLLSVLMLFVFQLLDRSLSLWERSEVKREFSERSSSVLELLADDLMALESGPRGDLVAEWVLFDGDGDGVRETKWPRVRVVRHASRAELERLRAGEAGEEGFGPDRSRGLIEVFWAVLPGGSPAGSSSGSPAGSVVRGVRIVGGDGDSFFDEGLFRRDGSPRPGLAHLVGGDCLWFGLQFATQTSAIHDGWSLGPELGSCATSWDGWRRGRPDSELHVWNDPHPGLPAARDSVLLPRRVRVELEIETDRDRRRATRLARGMTEKESSLHVGRGDRLPREPGRFVLVGAEWMELGRISGDTAAVRRGARGTEAVAHDAGEPVHFGARAVREVRVALYREDWGL